MAAVKPAAIFLNKKFKLPEGLSMSIVVISILLILITTFYAIGGTLSEEIKSFAEHVPTLSMNVANWLSNIPYLDNSVNQEEVQVFVSAFFHNMTDKFNYVVNTMGRAIFTAFRGIFMLLFIIIFSVYLFLERNAILKFIVRIFSVNHDNFNKLYNQIESQLGSWVRGQILLCFAVGFFTYIGLFVLGIKYALPLAILAGILEIIPIIGPLLTGLIITLVGLSSSISSGFLALLLSIAVQQLENHFLVPFVMKKTVGISPVVTIISLLIGQELFGILGAITAVPAAATLSVIINYYLESRDQKRD